MSHYLDDLKSSFSETEFRGVSELQEAEIAYFLQNSQPGDPDIVEVLVNAYAEEIQSLIQLVLFERFLKYPPSDLVNSIVVQTFTHAVNKIDQFWGEASVRNWLYALAIYITQTHNRRIGTKPYLGGGAGNLGDRFDEVKPTGISLLNDFSKKYRLVILLRYVLHLNIIDIASILDVKDQRVHDWLTDIRKRLLEDDRLQINYHESAKFNNPKRETHKTYKSRIHAYFDGLLEKNSKEDISLRDHLSICEDCKSYVDSLDHVLGQLEYILSDIWIRTELSEAQIEHLIQSIKDHLSRSSKGIRIVRPLRKVISMAFITILIVSGVFVLIRITPEKGEFPAAATPTNQILPTPIGPNRSTIPNEATDSNSTIAFYAMQPKISADGRWIVFATNALHSIDGKVQDTFDIMIYDTHAQTLERIGSQVLPLEESLFVSPDISGDGHWIVFNGYVNTVKENELPCQTYDNNTCVDIILYDNNNGLHERITKSYIGGPPNGDSMMPSISENGRWVLFWSFASNLVEGVPEPCDGDGWVVSCAELYIYDLINEEIEQIPIGRVLPPDREPEDILGGIDISSDGRWILLYILRSDRIAEQVGLSGDGDIYLYDREERRFEPISVAPDDTPGNDMSFSGQMTPDSKYIVFQSKSSNLVTGDDNNFIDVFLRDRSNGTVEIISQAPDGTLADGDSGIVMGVLGNIAITNDGRFVVFASTAGNLDSESSSHCIPSENNPCISIYVHDRYTGEIKNLAKPQEDLVLLYPTISDDGRWISYMESHLDCGNSTGLCVDLNLYDRERGWTSEVTRNLYPRDDISWELDTILDTIPYNISGVEFSPDGESIALFGSGRFVVIADVINGEELLTLRGNSSAAIRSLSFSPDGRYVAGGDSDGIVNIWRISDGSLAYSLDEHPGRIVDIQFSEDGEYLYVTTPRAVWIWHSTERKFTRINFLEYSDITIKDTDISPSNELMVIVPSQDSSIWIQRLPRGEVIHRLTGYGSLISSASFSPDGNYLIAQFNDGLTQLWKLDVDPLGSMTPILLKEDYLSIPFGRIDFSPNGAFVAAGSLVGGVNLWEIENDRNLIISDSFNDILISGVVISPSGNRLAAASRDGVYIWRKTSAPDQIELFMITYTDEFIQIPYRRRPIQDAVAGLDLDQIAIKGITLYEADDLVSFDLFAPFRVPANVTFVESSVMQDGGVLIHYRVDDRVSGQPIADLYFRQQLISEAIQPVRIGESALFENLQFNGHSAEYVKGDWLSIPVQKPTGSDAQDLQNIHWTWSSASEVQQIRWQHLDQLFSLSYIPRSNGEAPYQSDGADPGVGLYQQVHLTKYDLIEIASGISNLNRSFAPDRILVNYTVKPGETCTSIAFQYDTTVSTLTRLNRLSDNCEVIIEGQNLLVPLPKERLPLTEVDLDCDGKLERLQIVPTPLYVDSDISYGIILEALSDIGLYQKRWQYTVAEVDAEYIARPQLLPTFECQQLLALNVMGLTQDNDSGLRVFEWDAESMKLILTSEGWLQSVNPFESGLSISTLALEFLPGTSTCNRSTVVYTWNGRVFNETTRFYEEGGSCGLR